MRRLARILGTLLILGGLGMLAWTLLVWQWQDPFTYLYTSYKQRQLAASYERRFAHFQQSRPLGRRPVAPERRETRVEGRRYPLEYKRSEATEQIRVDARQQIRAEAGRYRLESRRGEVIARIKIPRLGLDMILVNGTDHDTLTRGPGRDPHTFMPGEGKLVYIAGHRTTYAAPFAHIDALRPGDRATIELPYATIVYTITRHVIVKSSDMSVLRSPGYELLALQACHPRFFATHRYIVYAKPVQVFPRFGRVFSPGDARLLAAA